MATSPVIPTQNQLKLARVALWHQDGKALQTLDDLRTWLDEAGLVPYTPHAQFAAAPQPSFAEAVLGRPEKGWIQKSESDEADGPSEDESYAVEVEDEEPADEVEISDEDFDDEDDNTPADEVEFADNEASDDETMLSNDDEAAEDAGEEIAVEDAIDAAAEEAAVPPTVINGFSLDERETVRVMLARLVEDGAAVPLNLLGNSLGEPDFVCSAQAFSFIYTLRGDKNFKNEPALNGSMRVSPLAAKVYEVLKAKGAMAPHELTTELGQGIVDSAVLRALSELWSILRVVPNPQADGEPTWELTTGRYLRHIKAGANAGQPTALSALLSLYLSQTLASTSDEAEIFLSPVAARSRVREVVNGLSASRQLESIVLDGKTVYFLPEALDNLPEDTTVASAEPVIQQRSRYEDDDRRAMIEARNARFAAEGGTPNERPSFGDRKPFGERREGGFAPRREGGFGERKSFGDRKPFGERKPFTPREGGERRPFTPRGDRPSFGDRKPFGDRGGRPSFGERREGGFGGPRREGGFTPQRRSFGGDREGFTPRPDRERRPFTRNEEGGATDRPRNEFARPWDEDRKPFTPREGGERRPFTPRGDRPSFGDRKPFGDRGGRPSFGDRKPFGDRESRGDRPFTPRGDRPSYGDRKPFGDRGGRPSFGGDRKPFTPREGGERRPFTPREGGDRPFTPRGDRPSYGDRKPFGDRGGRPSFGGDRKPFTPREGGERRPFTPREGGDRKPFAPRGDRPFTPRGDRPSYGGDRKPFGDRGGRPSFGGDRKPFTPREGGERRPFTPREGGDRKPFAPRGDRPSYGGDRKPFGDRGGRPSFGGDRKPFAPRGDRPSFGGDRGDRPSFGDRKPFGKPGFKPSFKGPGNGPARGGAPKRRPE